MDESLKGELHCIVIVQRTGTGSEEVLGVEAQLYKAEKRGEAVLDSGGCCRGDGVTSPVSTVFSEHVGTPRKRGWKAESKAGRRSP